MLTPRGRGDAASASSREDDLGLGFYEGDEIDLTPLVHEQAILALPTRPLCSEDVAGSARAAGPT